jgi:hypothetical protein
MTVGGPAGYQPSPSEWGAQPYGPSPYSAPPPPSTTRTGSSLGKTGGVLGLVVLLVFFALGWFGTDWYLKKRNVSYNSKISGLTFKYPAAWKKLDTAGISSVGGTYGMDSYNEILLADSTRDNMKYFMGSASKQITPEE